MMSRAGQSILILSHWNRLLRVVTRRRLSTIIVCGSTAAAGLRNHSAVHSRNAVEVSGERSRDGAVGVLITVIVWAFGQIEGCSSPASMRCSSVIESLLRPLDPERISSRRRRVSVQPAENKLLAVVFTRVIRAAPFNVPDV